MFTLITIIIIISEQLKTFFQEFVKIDDKSGQKCFKYREKITQIAHREMVAFNIDLDDVREFDEDLAEVIANNTRRYVNLVLEVN